MTTPSREVSEALRGLSERYAAGVDRRDADLFAGVFLPGAELSLYRTGKDELVGQMTNEADLRHVTENIKRFEQTMHLVGQSAYEVDGDHATGEVYCVAHHITVGPEASTNHVMYIRYIDAYGKDENGQWGIATRQVRPGWTETRPVDRSPT